MKKKNNTDKQFANIEEGLSKTEQFIEDNRNVLMSIIGAIIIAFLFVYGYKNFYKKPLNNKAQNQLFIGEQYFEKGDFQVALNGTEDYIGLINITEQYSNTQSGNLARYYAGISHLRLGEFENAIQMLEKYNSEDKLLASIAKGAIGDAFAELNQPKEAIEYYKKAIRISSNNLTTPIFLMKCANIYESEEKFQEAKSCYLEIQSDYPESSQAKNIEKYINKLK